MALFGLFRKKKPEEPYVPISYQEYMSRAKDDYVPPVFDYAPENYARNYPRNYPMTSFSTIEDGVVFTKDAKEYLLRDLVKRVIFTDAPFPEGYKLVDVSLMQDRSVLAWNQTIGGELCLVLSTGEKGRGIQLNRVSGMMFACFTNLESIEWNNVIKTSEIRGMKEMFAGCEHLKYVDLSSFDLRNIKFLDGLFKSCVRLRDIKWFKFDTPNLISTSYMFTNCWHLRSVDFRNFDSKSVKYSKRMFNECNAMKAIRLGDWGAEDVDIEEMFYGAGMLTVLSTSNKAIQKEFMNPVGDGVAENLEEWDLTRKVVPDNEWKVPIYSFETEKDRRGF